jgi:hypothetical protein
MRKSWLAALAGVLTLAPLCWLLYFVAFYRCDLARYSRIWRAGAAPAWLTGWEIAVTVAGALVALIVAPKVLRGWRNSTPLPGAEWAVLCILIVLIVVAALSAPLAMVDPQAKISAFLGQRTDQCVH